jgi:FtsP/CotA-like multicopper oxidase with cupredoxin domain
LLLTALPAAHAAASVATALPEVVSSSGALSTTLYVDEFIMTDSTGTNKIRGFGTTAVLAGTDTTNVLRPGPLIRCKAGDQLTVVLVNNLGTAGQQGADWGGTHTTNSHTDSDSTNLHTHGLHIDSDSPQDNVLK